MINTGRKHLVHIVKYRWWWMLLTTILIVPGIIAMIYSSVTYSNHAPLKVGIDYTGGTILQYGLEQKLENSDVTKTREALEGIGIENPYIQILNVNNSQQKIQNQTLIQLYQSEQNSLTKVPMMLIKSQQNCQRITRILN